MAKKGERLSKETISKIRKSKIKNKKLCKHCEKLFENLDKHNGNCRKNPENKERFYVERRDYLKKEDIKTRVQFQKATVWRKWYPNNAENLTEKRKNNYPKNKDKLNAQRNISRPKNDIRTRNSLVGILGGHICSNVECRFNDPRALNIEHIHDTGHLDDKRFTDDRQRNGYYVKHPIEAVENLQVFCANCNAIKEHGRKKTLKKSDTLRNIQGREEYQKLRNLAVETLGGYICVQCGFTDKRSLDIEHIYNDGNISRKKITRYDGFYRDIIKNSKLKKTLQIMCRNCNEIKKKVTESENNQPIFIRKSLS